MTISDSRCLMENGASCLPCTPEEEKSIITDLKTKAEAHLEEGNLYYVISSRWFNGWAQYVGQWNDYTVDDHVPESEDVDATSSLVANRPGPIDNSDIVLKENRGQSDELELLRTLQEGHDYFLVPELVWLKLFDWYNGGPVLPRKLISHGLHKDFNVEVYPLRFTLIDSRDGSESLIRLSKKASVKDLCERVFALKGVKAEEVRVWDYFNRQKNFILVISNQTLEDSNLLMDQDILLEVQQNGSWPPGSSADSTGNELALVPMEPLRSSMTIAGGPALSNGYSMGCVTTYCQEGSLDLPHADVEGDMILTQTDTRGLAGLQNLGNTCFMNSAVQCLVHTTPLLEYFLHDFTEEINKHNPLGMHGELAIVFGELLRKLWSSGQTAIVPRAFKGKLARFAPQFSGYNQHDAQELLAFLLDGLHEDLNRVKKKPYIEINDSDGLFDEEVAEECWKNHKARNDSIIVDVCQGQYKSTLVCPVCQKVSVTFDPFMYLSLPLPSTVTRAMTVAVLYGDGSGLPMPYTVSVQKHGCCKDLCEALGAACCLSSRENLFLAEVFEHRICRYMDNPAEPLSSIKDDDHIVAYRLPKMHGEQIRVELLHQHRNNGKFGEGKLLGTPLVTDIEGLNSVDDFHEIVGKILSPFKKEHIASHKVNNVLVNGYGSTFVDGLIDDFNPQVGLGSRLMSGSTSDGIIDNSNPQAGLGSPLMNSSESDEVCCMNTAFKLSIIDEMGWGYIPLEEVSVVKSDKILQIMIEWTNTMHEFYDYSYLEYLPEVCKVGFTMKKTRQESISLFSCLDAFLKEEPLGPDDMWYCPGCKEHRQATKKLDLWRLPDILVFHLKRFSYSRYLKNKLDTFVNFPIHDLDLSKYVKNKSVSSKSHMYKLYAVSNHYGGLGGGHYSAYAKLVDEDRWYHFDDSHVSLVGEGEIKTAAAYVLFYEKMK